VVCSFKDFAMGDDITIFADEKPSSLIDGSSFFVISESSDGRWLNSLDNG
jgi:hypothetical protein